MLGRYIFLYQLEMLQEEAEISKFQNITLSSALPPHIRRRSCKGVFHIAQMPATSNVYKLSCIRGHGELQLVKDAAHPDCRHHTLDRDPGGGLWPKGKCPFCQHPAINVKIINLFLSHSDLFSYSKDNSSSIFHLHYVCARHHCSHKSK